MLPPPSGPLVQLRRKNTAAKREQQTKFIHKEFDKRSRGVVQSFCTKQSFLVSQAGARDPTKTARMYSENILRGDDAHLWLHDEKRLLHSPRPSIVLENIVEDEREAMVAPRPEFTVSSIALCFVVFNLLFNEIIL